MNALFFTKYLRISKNCCTFAPAFEICSHASVNASPATVAQLVEQRIRNAWVGGSSPPSGSQGTFGFLFYIVSIKNFCFRLNSAIPITSSTKIMPPL